MDSQQHQQKAARWQFALAPFLAGSGVKCSGRSVILIIKQLLVQAIGLSHFQRTDVTTKAFIVGFLSKAYPPCPEQQQVYHKILLAFDVCRGRCYSPSCRMQTCS